MKNIYALLAMMFIVSIAFASAEEKSLADPTEINQPTILLQTCSNCTYINVTTLITPSNNISLNVPMTNNRGSWIYVLSGTYNSEIGTYTYTTCGDSDGSYTCQSVTYEVTRNGEDISDLQGYIIIGFIGITALLMSIGFSFDKSKWKVRSLFFIGALLMGLLTLNSIRIISGTSGSLDKMGEVGLIFGMIVISFMFLFMLINYTIEVFNYFKEKRRMKWEVDEQV